MKCSHCDREVVAHSLCAYHYQRQRRGLSLDAQPRTPRRDAGFVGFRVSAEEKDQMVKAAGSRSLSEWIREVVMSALRGVK